MQPISHYSNNRDNNFNLIRVIAALLVLYSHCYPLALGMGNSDPIELLIGRSLGEIAVDIFFITSGFLVAASLFHQKSVGLFLKARLLRIFPALFVAMMFCVFFVGLIFTTLPTSDFLAHSEVHTYLKKNLTLLWGDRYNLPGVFEGNIYPSAVNGSIWTLPWELKMYVLLALTAFLARGYKHWAIIALAVIGFTTYTIDQLELFGGLDENPNKLRFLSFFFMGSVCYLYRERIYLSHRFFGSILIVLVCSTILKLESLFFLTYAAGLAYLILYLAYIPNGTIRKFNRLGDYSYGIYIYAFPIQQISSALHPGITVLEMLLLVTPATLFFAVLSWHLIEKPSLKFKNRRR